MKKGRFYILIGLLAAVLTVYGYACRDIEDTPGGDGVMETGCRLVVDPMEYGGNTVYVGSGWINTIEEVDFYMIPICKWENCVEDKIYCPSMWLEEVKVTYTPVSPGAPPLSTHKYYVTFYIAGGEGGSSDSLTVEPIYLSDYNTMVEYLNAGGSTLAGEGEYTAEVTFYFTSEWGDEQTFTFERTIYIY